MRHGSIRRGAARVVVVGDDVSEGLTAALGQEVAAQLSPAEALTDTLALDEETQAVVDEFRSAFEESVQSAIDDYSQQGGLDTASLEDALRSAFDTYVEQLRDELKPDDSIWQAISGGQEKIKLGAVEVNSRACPMITVYVWLKVPVVMFP